MIGPQAYFADELMDWDVSAAVQHPEHGEVFVLCRPLCASWHETLINRLRMAWEVFTGKSDVLRWHQQ